MERIENHKNFNRPQRKPTFNPDIVKELSPAETDVFQAVCKKLGEENPRATIIELRDKLEKEKPAGFERILNYLSRGHSPVELVVDLLPETELSSVEH